MTKTEFSSKSPSYSFIVINKPCKAQFLLRVLACYNIRMCSLNTGTVFLCFVCYQSKQRSFRCRLAVILITATLTVGMLGLNLTWGVNTCLFFFLYVTLCRNILHEIRKLKANWIGHILRRNCFLKQIIEGKIKGEIEVTRRRGRRRKKLLDDLKDRGGYSYLKEEALDRTMWRNRFGGGFGPVVRQNTE